MYYSDHNSLGFLGSAVQVQSLRILSMHMMLSALPYHPFFFG